MAGETEGRDYVAIAEQWAKDVVARRIVACKPVRQACKRHLDDLKRSKKDRAKAWDCVFDPWHGWDVCDFIEKLPHVKGQWETPTLRLEPPQVFILVTLFGWRRRSTGRRRFTTAYIEMARKGAKSTLAAGIGLYCLCCEGEVGPEIYVGATTGAQALKVFEPMQGMVRKTPDLREAFGLTVWAKSITCAENGGFIQTINAKGSTQDGHNPHCVILDELHAHADRALFDVMLSALGSRESPLMLVITTAGFNVNGVCYEQRAYAMKVLEGVFEADHVFGVVFTLDDGDDPYDEKNWPKANPMLGVTPKLPKMREYARDAKASPSYEGNFKTKNLNIWLGAASAWLNMAKWKACADPTLDWSDFRGLEATLIGGDLADKDDITAVVLAAFRPSPILLGQTQLIMKPMFWLPEAVLEDPLHAEGRGPAPYRTWHLQGHLELTPGDWVDHNAVEAEIRGWVAELGTVKHITFDQFAAAQAMASRLNEDLASPDAPIAAILHKKASAVTDPARELETRVKGGPGRFLHDDNPVMNWMASNVVVARRRDETILPIKESQGSPNKIDGIDALINAIEPWVRVGPAPPAPSYLETEDLVVL
jgi:phage terminase large subunit-like protein